MAKYFLHINLKYSKSFKTFEIKYLGICKSVNYNELTCSTRRKFNKERYGRFYYFRDKVNEPNLIYNECSD